MTGTRPECRRAAASGAARIDCIPQPGSRPLRAVSNHREARTAALLPAARRAPDGPAGRHEYLGTARSAGVARPGTRPVRASPPRATGDLLRRREVRRRPGSRGGDPTATSARRPPTPVRDAARSRAARRWRSSRAPRRRDAFHLAATLLTQQLMAVVAIGSRGTSSEFPPAQGGGSDVLESPTEVQTQGQAVLPDIMDNQ